MISTLLKYNIVRQKNIFLLTLGLLLLMSGLNAQQILVIKKNDRVKLTTNTTDIVQWQTSPDASRWIDIADAKSANYEAQVNTFPVYFRAKLKGVCKTNYSQYIAVYEQDTSHLDDDGDGVINSQDNCVTTANPNQLDTDNDGIGDVCDTDNSVAYQLWSDLNTWGDAGKPQAGQEIVIPAGKHILLDENPPALAGLIIDGTLEFKRTNLQLTSEWIVVRGGKLTIGSEAKPFQQKAIVTLNDTDTEASFMNMGTRGIIVIRGGVLDLHGQTPKVFWTKINAHAEAGSSKLTLAQPVNWTAGQEVIVGPSDFYEANGGTSVTQKITISGVNREELTLNAPLNAFRWGKLQYATMQGMSLEPNHIITSVIPDEPDFITPKVLDERAPVGNLTRNIVIQSPEDDVWKNQGFGVHIMIMPGSSGIAEGIEIKRGGQRGRIRRYPWHWHVLSYSGTQTLADATGQYFKGNTINVSENRGIVVHATNGVVVKDNIVFHVKGHGIFTEDAVERRNIFDHNLVLHVRNPAREDAIKLHELSGFNKGSSGFWLSNPDNTTINNHVADCEGNGFWLAFPSRPFGAGSQVLHTDGKLLAPQFLLFGKFENNTAHSVLRQGFNTDLAEKDEAGNTGGLNYESTTTGRKSPWPYTTRRRYTLKGLKSWKNKSDGLWDRANWVNLFEIVAADNYGRCFAGAGFDGVIYRCLAIGKSLNYNKNNAKRSFIRPGYASYHHTFDTQNSIAINFPVTPTKESGAFSTVDYYIRGLEKGLIRYTNNIVINSHPGYKLTPAQGWRSNRVDPVNPHFSLAGALWDPQGYWGPKETYLVFDDPFYTYGLEKHIHESGIEATGGVSVNGPFYGMQGFILNNANKPWSSYYGLKVRRLDDDFNQVGLFELVSAAEGVSSLLKNMRDFVTHPTGIYELTFPSDPAPASFSMQVTNMLTEGDQLLIAIEFSGEVDAKVGFGSQASKAFAYTEKNSLEEVKSSEGETYWQDTNNNLVWVKLRGGRWAGNPNDPKWERPLYEQLTLFIDEK